VVSGTGFSSTTVTPTANNSTTSTLTIVTNNSTAIGTANMTVRASSSGYVTKNQAISLTVNTAADFSISVSPGSTSVTQGGNATYTVTVTSLNGFNAGVLLEVLNLPN